MPNEKIDTQLPDEILFIYHAPEFQIVKNTKRSLFDKTNNKDGNRFSKNKKNVSEIVHACTLMNRYKSMSFS
jgi:hypothetical protein